jgi:hypothetical protein
LHREIIYHSQNSTFGICTLDGLWFKMLYGHLVFFKDVWLIFMSTSYFLWSIGIFPPLWYLYQDRSGNPDHSMGPGSDWTNTCWKIPDWRAEPDWAAAPETGSADSVPWGRRRRAWTRAWRQFCESVLMGKTRNGILDPEIFGKHKKHGRKIGHSQLKL